MAKYFIWLPYMCVFGVKSDRLLDNLENLGFEKGGTTMDIWLVSFIGGLIGSVFMDITEAKMAQHGIRSGVTGPYIGRWAHGLMRGVFFHKNITETPSVKHETRIAMAFHFIIGGGVVALFYPLFLLIIGLDASANHLLWATLLWATFRYNRGSTHNLRKKTCLK